MYQELVYSLFLEGMPREFMSRVGRKFNTKKVDLPRYKPFYFRDKYVYHMTPETNVNSIAREGLKKREKDWDYFDDNLPEKKMRIYLTRKKSYLKQNSPINDRVGPQRAVVAKYKGVGRPDTEYVDTGSKSRRAFYVTKDIPKSRILGISKKNLPDFR